MKIYVDKIPQEGLILIEKIEPLAISLGLERDDILFKKPIDAKAIISKSGSEVFVEVSIESPVEYTCSRCLVKVQDIFKKRFNVNYEVKAGDIVEVDDDIRQEMILDYPMKVVCKPDCKGLCPNCGQNLNIADCGCT